MSLLAAGIWLFAKFDRVTLRIKLLINCRALHGTLKVINDPKSTESVVEFELKVNVADDEIKATSLYTGVELSALLVDGFPPLG